MVPHRSALRLGDSIYPLPSQLSRRLLRCRRRRAFPTRPGPVADPPFGRIALANTDLAGAMDHRYSMLEARGGVSQLLDAVVD